MRASPTADLRSLAAAGDDFWGGFWKESLTKLRSFELEQYSKVRGWGCWLAPAFLCSLACSNGVLACSQAGWLARSHMICFLLPADVAFRSTAYAQRGCLSPIMSATTPTHAPGRPPTNLAAPAPDPQQVIYLDADGLVWRNMDHLFLLPPGRVAMPRSYWELKGQPQKLTSAMFGSTQSRQALTLHLQAFLASCRPAKHCSLGWAAIYVPSARTFHACLCTHRPRCLQCWSPRPRCCRRCWRSRTGPGASTWTSSAATLGGWGLVRVGEDGIRHGWACRRAVVRCPAPPSHAQDFAAPPHPW